MEGALESGREKMMPMQRLMQYSMRARRAAHLGVTVGAVLVLWILSLPGASAAEASDGPQPGDLVRVTVYGQPDLTTLARVATDNTISFPFIGHVQVGGISISQAQNNIERALDQKGILRNPQVNVLVENQGAMSGEFVTILGHVQKPGRYSLGDDSEIATGRLLDLIAVAGGRKDDASTKVVVFHDGDGASDKSKRVAIDLDGVMRGDALQQANVKLKPGDVVIVPEQDVFYIYGQVSHPGRYPLEKNMMVMQAISVGGGITERGNESGILLTRRQGNKERRLNADLHDVIHPGDVIYVKEKFF